MGRPAKATQEPDDQTDNKKKILTPEEQADLFMKANSKDHYNFEVGDEYRVSTGSLKLDIITGGGITPGVTRLVGTNSGGKTSEGLELIRNFFLVKPKGRALYVKAEGRLSNEVKTRSGVNFTTNPLEWHEGTCLIYECNIFESVASFIMSLIQNNPLKINYVFMIDSLDGLILRDDMLKGLNEAYKVAGPQVIGKKLMQKTALPLVKYGHILIFTSQITAQPKIDPYAQLPFRAFASSGGNWALHYPDNIWEFLPRFKDDLILKNPKAKYDQQKNPIIGHLASLVVRKSSNEKNDVKIKYPIRYQRSNGTSIWKEREIGDILSVYHMEVNSSWFTFNADMLKEIQAIDPKCPVKIQGIDQIYEFLENNELVTKFLFEKFATLFKQEQIWDGDTDPLGDDALEEAA